MADASLMFTLIGRDLLTPTLKRAAGELEGVQAKAAGSGSHGAAGLLGGLAVADVVGHAVKAAGDFQFQMNRIVHAAGESQTAIGMVGDGLQKMMMATGTSMSNATSGLYTIESAGYHGADALKILTAAAKGAKIENADLGGVANALSSIMVDFHYNAGQSAQVMNTLIAGVAHGKTTMDGMAAAMANVGAAGASAHIPIADLTAAVATMTMHGTDAAKAGTYLRQVIGQLEAPSAAARTTMKGLGIDANHLGLTLTSGPGGLAKAIGMVDDAITKHLSPSGLVAVETFKKSNASAADWQKLVSNLPPTMQTAFGALSHMTGGVKSLQGFLQLGGENLKTFKANTDAINESVKRGGNDIDGWAQTQKTFNVVMDRAKAVVEVAGIAVGTILLPPLQAVFGEISAHQTLFVDLAIGIVGAATAFYAVKLATAAWGIAMNIVKAATVAWTIVQNLLNITLLGCPLLLIIAGIALLALGIYELVKHFDAVKAAVKVAFDAVLSAVQVAWNWIKGHWPLLLAILIGPIGIAVYEIVKHWDALKSAAAAVWHVISGAFSSMWSAIKSGISTAISWFKALPGNILSAIGNLANTLFQYGKDLIQGFINGIKNMAGNIASTIKDSVVGVAKSALHGFGWFGSPSKLTFQYGKWWSEGFALGMKETSAQIVTQAKNLLDTLKQKLTDARNYQQQIVANFQQGADITQLGGTGSQGLLTNLTTQADQAGQFAAAVAALRSAGLNATTLGQIRDAGVSGGLSTAQALLAGGQIAAINAQEARITAAGSTLGRNEAIAQYGVDPDAANKLLVKMGHQKVTVGFDFTNAGDDAFVEMMRKAIRVRGGNVQVALGAK